MSELPEDVSDMTTDFADQITSLMKQHIEKYGSVQAIGDILSGMAGVLFGAHVIMLRRIQKEVDRHLASQIAIADINVLQGKDMRTGMTRQ